MFRHIKVALMIILVIASFAAYAETLEVPDGVKVITAPETKKMLSENKALVVNTLSRIEYQMQHIPDTINIPVDEIATSEKMPKDKNSRIIFYCNGEACPYSRRAAEIAVELGYKQVYWFKEGILSWRKYQYDMEVNKELNSIKVDKLRPEELQKLLNTNVQIIDVRPLWWRESQIQAGFIKGTELLIPLLKLDQSLHLIDKSRPIVVVDRQMRQSQHAAKYLVQQGYQILGILKGGSKRWVNEGFPTLSEEEEPLMIRSK